MKPNQQRNNKPVLTQKLFDCRACAHFDLIKNKCHSVVLCIQADRYTGKPLIQLWELNEKTREEN